MNELLAGLELELGELPTSERFMIDTPLKAEWALGTIKQERMARDCFIEAAAGRIEKLQQQIRECRDQCDSRTSYLLILLNDYLDSAPARATKTQLSLALPSGKLVRKLPKKDFGKDEATLLSYVQQNAPEYIKSDPKVNWAELKKDLEILGNIVVRKSTGEPIDCITVVDKPSSFDVEV